MLRTISLFYLCIICAETSLAAPNYCVQNSGASAADLSAPVSVAFLRKMKNVGVKTVIRYYDYENETIKGKTLRRSERDLIIGKGFDLAVVFQHHNNMLASFTAARGRADAVRSLFLAYENAQPSGSLIYFGVDGSWRGATELAKIRRYFRAAKEVLTPSGYHVGVYGSGLVCEELLSDGLAQFCWLANAKSWPGYNQYLNSRAWRIAQRLPQDCGGQTIDFNVTNGIYKDYGQFGP